MSEVPRVVVSRESPWFTAFLREDGLLVYRAVPGLVIDHTVAVRIIEIGLQIVDEPKPTMVLMQDMARVDREARALFASDSYNQVCSQTALVVGSPVSRVIGNFFVGLNRSKHLFRIFDDSALAADWLRGFVP
jgi:hypothetical protein